MVMRMTMDRVERKMQEAGGGFPEEAKAWMRRFMLSAIAEADAARDGIIRERLVNALVERFTQEELEDLLARQALLRQTKFAGPMLASRDLPNDAQMQALRKAVTAEEFEAFIQATGSPVVTSAVRLTIDQAKLAMDDYLDRLDRALARNCPSAPRGIQLCVNPLKPL
jgi:hypothetical protein